MRNVESSYSVVGVQSDLSGTVAVLSRLLPRFFGDVGDRTVRNRKSNYPEPSAEALTALRRNISLDIEFYKFVKQRLRSQKDSLGLAETSSA